LWTGDPTSAPSRKQVRICSTDKVILNITIPVLASRCFLGHFVGRYCTEIAGKVAAKIGLLSVTSTINLLSS
jgi:hypothetical protein